MTTRHDDGISLRREAAVSGSPDAGRLPRPPDHEESDVRGVCHDLRQSVSTIRAIAELMVADRTAPASWRARAGSIVQEATNAAKLCQAMVSPTPSVSTCDLADVAQSAAASASLRLNRSATPLLLLNEALAPIDRLTGWRIATNLIDNGCRAAGPHGAVVIATFVRDGCACLCVDDDAANGPYPSGSGVGLTVVQSALKPVDGRLRLEFSALGGTRASVSIPTTAPRPDDVPAQRPEWEQSCVC